MGSRVIREMKKHQLVMHRIAYFIFLLEGIFSTILKQDVEWKYSAVMILILAVCEVFEELMEYHRFFKKNEIRKWTRLGQCQIETFLK